MAKSNCLSCHKPAVKLIGPSFDEIAAKYPPTEENYKMLTEKIKKGGTGNWGSVPMSPHPEIAEGDAKKMLNYILKSKHQHRLTIPTPEKTQTYKYQKNHVIIFKKFDQKKHATIYSDFRSNGIPTESPTNRNKIFIRAG